MWFDLCYDCCLHWCLQLHHVMVACGLRVYVVHGTQLFVCIINPKLMVKPSCLQFQVSQHPSLVSTLCSGICQSRWLSTLLYKQWHTILYPKSCNFQFQSKWPNGQAALQAFPKSKIHFVHVWATELNISLQGMLEEW